MRTCIALDAFGGDHAPGPEVEGALQAVREAAVEILLVGDRARLDEALARAGATPGDAIRVVHAGEVVTMDDHPAHAFRAKRDSSLRVAVERVKSGEAAAIVSAGNSGAVLAHGLLLLGRLPGVDRPAVVTVLPTPSGPLSLCDAGANVDVKPAMLAQFARLGAAYDAIVHHREPRVGLLANGTEAHKGTELTRAAHALLTAAPQRGWRYVGYVEPNALFHGAVDVVATDGFTGNVVLKTAEGFAEAFLPRIHYAEVGGALLAGVEGVVIVCHGRSDATAIKNGILRAAELTRADVSRQITQLLARLD